MADFISCDNANLTIEQLAGALLTKTSTGDIAVRVMLVEACADDAIDCSNNAVPLDQLLKASIGIGECSKPALRLGLKKTALLTALGIPTYANNAAAVTGGMLTNQAFYNSTTSKITVVT